MILTQIEQVDQLDARMRRLCGIRGSYEVTTVKTATGATPYIGAVYCTVKNANYPGSEDLVQVDVRGPVTAAAAVELLDQAGEQ